MKTQFCKKGKVLGRIKGCSMKRWIGAVEVFLLLAACALHGAKAGHYADFYPLNGTFQNFNPVRRLLDGQVPYRDFVDYLGLGHLYGGGVCTALLGGDYRASLTAFSFLTILSLALTLAVIRGDSQRENSGSGIFQCVPVCIAHPPVAISEGARSDGDDCFGCGRRLEDR